MSERALVHLDASCTASDRGVAAGIQWRTSTQFARLPDAEAICKEFFNRRLHVDFGLNWVAGQPASILVEPLLNRQ
jgi:hypothetical protein